MPATMAVVIPAAAPTPDATPKPSARGSATRATMRPAERSRPIVVRDQSERRDAKHTARDRMPTVEAAEEGRLPDPGFRGDEQQGGMVDFAVFDLAIELV